ncbi:hypothetical protein MMCCUG48898_3745 [Mycobacteroides abscessus subsp. massiliense CCUG 48898 = JCM 15300]|nr:hypothetical protein MMAS_35930 [Mycobacteroides abscessus subsp. massiliense CCUG 48898 = JCM 15300]EIV64832.1 hypothetical protein MMCCUG48898_3745 [Mycobacteroides abscessus subsp. massiliense CCUG 48898 = JCM 15300]BAP98506.1 hypothetical protein MMASJCM_3730 [Mycobacteroides abscessus subsp. massiliense CCUG 48898 = JCM 15300]
MFEPWVNAPDGEIYRPIDRPVLVLTTTRSQATRAVTR